MRNSNIPEPELLKTVLQPLLDDFQYWFASSRNLLETERLSFLNQEEQSNLLLRVKQAQEELQAAKMMFHATDGKVGVEMTTLMPWHNLVTECWSLTMRFRSLKKG